MKYTCSVIIHKPLQEVVAKFNDVDNLKHWQPGFVSYEHVSGEYGKPGAVSNFTFLMGKKKMVLTETILVNNLPEEFSVEFGGGSMKNIVKSYFKSIDENTTSYESDNEFHMKGAMKILGWIMPGAFKKQSMVYVNNFKAFVEKGTSVAS
ncbi:MAG: SRPBCC family protein [Saprospiraceae bacterium]|nr:SRPBCC family protein [Saprospiraceae bacterium]MBK6783085.1 SRPBCC family protein [Saprospiraceae bacterium]MBK7523581.1 SRPBCC family protein [Saprospiraceae bacterium]MBK8079693.1 SRPBCC family protein [Saprospiraceae bacterium]MBK8371429.1 SRPBCC family protein [Saprospiraceae bacterium]